MSHLCVGAGLQGVGVVAVWEDRLSPDVVAEATLWCRAAGDVRTIRFRFKELPPSISIDRAEYLDREGKDWIEREAWRVEKGGPPWQWGERLDRESREGMVHALVHLSVDADDLLRALAARTKADGLSDICNEALGIRKYVVAEEVLPDDG